VSCDQELAEAIGKATRYPSLVLGIKRGTGSTTRRTTRFRGPKNGTPIPAENRPHALFDQLFRPDTPETLAQRGEADGVIKALV